MKKKSLSTLRKGILNILICIGLANLTLVSYAQSDIIQGISTARLERLTGVMQEAAEKEKIPGAVMLIARKGEIIYHKAVGMADVEAKRRMDTNAMFQIASMTKPITSVAVMMLYEQGEFLLNDPIEKYIPAFKDVKVFQGKENESYDLVEPRKKITIRHLLNFTSGITAGRGLPKKLIQDIKEESGWHAGSEVLSDRIKEIAKFPLISHPGEAFHYGNATDVLGYLVEIISGMPFNEYLDKNIFTPLKMDDTYFVMPAEKTGRLARMYSSERDSTISAGRFNPDKLMRRTYFSGGSGLISTASDYYRFTQLILNKGQLDGVRLLGRKTVELMTTNSIGELYSPFRYNSGDKFGYGFGIRTERGQFDELESLGIVGWDGAYYTRFWIDPKEELIAIFMSQVSGKWGIDPSVGTKFRVLVYQSIID